MPLLYHYSPLCHLPDILAGGLSKGELADGRLPPRVTGVVNLTSQTDPNRLFCWGPDPKPASTAVRYVCRIPDGDTRLVVHCS